MDTVILFPCFQQALNFEVSLYYSPPPMWFLRSNPCVNHSGRMVEIQWSGANCSPGIGEMLKNVWKIPRNLQQDPLNGALNLSIEYL